MAVEMRIMCITYFGIILYYALSLDHRNGFKQTSISLSFFAAKLCLLELPANTENRQTRIKKTKCKREVMSSLALSFCP